MGKSADNTVSALAEDISNEKSVSDAEYLQNESDSKTESIAKKALLKSKKTTARRPAMKLRNSLTELFVPIILKKKKKSISFHQFSCSSRS